MINNNENNDVKVDNNVERDESFKVEFEKIINAEEDEKTCKLIEDDELINVPPDGGWGWIIVATSFLIFLITEGTIYAYGIFFQELNDDLKLTRSQISLIGAVKSSSVCFSGKI